MSGRVRRASLLAFTNRMAIKMHRGIMEDMDMSHTVTTKATMMVLMKDSRRSSGSNTKIRKRLPCKVVYWTQTPHLHSKDQQPIRMNRVCKRQHRLAIVLNYQTKVRVLFVGQVIAVANCLLITCTRRQISWILYSLRGWFLIQTSILGQLRLCARSVINPIMRRQLRK